MNAKSTLSLSPHALRRRKVVLAAACTPIALTAGCGGGMGVSTASTALAPSLVEPFAAAGTRPALPIVAQDAGTLDGSGTRAFTLRVQDGTTQFLDGATTATRGYNGAVLGPALRLHTGEKVTLRVRNDLGEATSVHWHGLVVPAEVDGGPHQPIAPGATWSASFTVANPASTCWFHPHLHGATGRQVVSGLAGLLIVDDGAVAPSTLPDTWGVDDLALVLQDKRFTASGQIDYALTDIDSLAGYSGDHLLVNGSFGPVWQAPRQWVRLRLLNGCNARTLTLRLGNAASLFQVANEGGLLAAPVARTAVTLAPGERAEVLADFSGMAAGQEVALLASSTVDSGVGMGMGMGGGSSSSEVMAMRIRVSLPAQPDAMRAPPSRLPAAPGIVAGGGASVRSFALDGGMMTPAFTINGRSFDIRRVDFAVASGTVEVWQFGNFTGMAHPVHVHGVRMSLLSRGGAPPALHELGLRDTFVVAPMQNVAVAVQTPAVASATPLMLHCHILEHEDAGMMGQFITV